MPCNCQFYFEDNCKGLAEEFQFVETVFQLIQKIFLHKSWDVFLLFGLLNPVRKTGCPCEADWIVFS